MIARTLQRFSVALLPLFFLAATDPLQIGSSTHLLFRDVDGNEHSTAGGKVTIITVVTRQNEAKAQAVGDHVPDRVVGDRRYTYITLVNFQRKLFSPLQGLTKAIIRKRLDAEANRIRPEYNAKHITHDPRQDIFVVADFDGNAVTQLGLTPEFDGVAVFVFSGHGKLVARWNDVPSEDVLAKAISAAE
ncbi:MAG: hypothetical protein ACXV8A_05090 [Chthoniobacterales bacterium]